MRAKLQTFGEIILLGTVLLIIFCVGIVLSPILVISSIDNHFTKKRLNQNFYENLLKLEGDKIFCYNNRKNSQEFIEKYIIPTLSSDVHIIFLNGRTPVNDYYSQIFSSSLLNQIKNQVGFPYLMKISGGQILEKSINNELYNILNQGKEIKPLHDIISNFYE
ncbi:hypothetical protein [Pedobacter sp.]|uniref:hypothetical protein n=1 Tax=Pedobacter sp. TaxID=1411316 RepID=UPI003BA89467